MSSTSKRVLRVPKRKIPGCIVATWSVDLTEGPTLLDLLSETHIADTRSEARRMIGQGSIYLNDERCTDPKRRVNVEDLRPVDPEGCYPAAVWISTKHRRMLLFVVHGQVDERGNHEYPLEVPCPRCGSTVGRIEDWQSQDYVVCASCGYWCGTARSVRELRTLHEAGRC